MIGFYAADGNRRKNIYERGLKTCIGMRDDKFNVFPLNNVMTTSDENVNNIIKLGKRDMFMILQQNAMISIAVFV